MLKQSFQAGLRGRRIEDEFRLPVFLLHGVGMANHDGAIWIMVRGKAQPEKTQVDPIGKEQRPQGNEKCHYKPSFKPVPEFGCRQRHEAKL